MIESSHRFILLNNQQVVSAAGYFAARHLYGSGVFTTLTVYSGKPFLWEKHWRRLAENAEKIGIDVSNFSDGGARMAVADLIEKNKVRDGRVRMTFFDESASAIWTSEAEQRVSFLVMTANLRALEGEFRLTISPYRINSTSPLAGVKSCNYLEKILAKEEAKQLAFDEAIQLNERGEIASACMANVFWQTDGRFFTPSLRTGCLAGTTREFVLENLECDEVEAGIEELKCADAIYLTSAGVGVTQVAEFDGRELRREPHAIMKLLPPRN